MKNIFSKERAVTPKPKRNTFDLSHATNFTAKMGFLYPILCQEVLPGESFRISARAQMNAMPLKFPIQTPINAHFHYFYCRNRNVYDDWQDYITKVRDGLQSPYLQMNESRASVMLKNGELADFLGVPTDIYGEYGAADSIHVFKYANAVTPPLSKWGYLVRTTLNSTPSCLCTIAQWNALSGTNLDNFISFVTDTTNPSGLTRVSVDAAFPYPNVLGNDYQARYANSCLYFLNDTLQNFSQSFVLNLGAAHQTSSSASSDVSVFFFDVNYNFIHVFPLSVVIVAGNTYSTYSLSDQDYNSLLALINRYPTFRIALGRTGSNSSTLPTSDSITFNAYNGQDSISPALNTLSYVESVVLSSTESKSSISAVDNNVISSNPFVGSTPDIPLNALPFRHYEMIYNSFYRDTLNNPFFVNGEQQFNEFIPTHAGGADTNIYRLHRRNWELDFLTSAVPTPQFGNAPLVGITVNNISNTATLTLDITDGNLKFGKATTDAIKAGGTTPIAATSTIENFKVPENEISGSLSGTAEIDVTLGSDGETIVGISRYDRSVPPSSLQDLFQSINYGISINDLRNVNSMQRFLENMIRKGSLKYRDQLQAHFGVEPDYKEIDLPSFEGGFTIPIGVRTVTQSAATSVDGNTQHLGDIAGQIIQGGNQDNDVQIYTPEHGYIFCIMSITPIPVYSQLLPKYLTKVNNSFEYFTPEFSKIGFQPISYKEVCPLQSAIAGDSLNDVFGYQRPWYEYLQQYDTVHGLLRTNLRDFLINRVFNSRPQLGEDFLLVDPKQVNDVFAVTEEDNDTFVCQAYFDIKAKRIIPRFGIPSLE